MTAQAHNFHIPVMGIGFTIDAPIKVARFGINSTLSIIEDELLEQMRKHYSNLYHLPYTEISTYHADFRAKRITAYLNLVDYIVSYQANQLRKQPFNSAEMQKYFSLLPDDHDLKLSYNTLPLLTNAERLKVERFLRSNLVTGAIEVNIMTKVDKPKFNDLGEPLPAEQSDALSALRGFANSDLHAAVVFSAGFNPRVYGYCESFADFYPDENGHIKKKIILKVSDYRSALIQGKYLAKKGLWVSEFRIESGLNCGGHAFATDGLLMGPILEEFKNKRGELYQTLYTACLDVLQQSGKHSFNALPELKITAQGGIGTAHENNFLITYYNLDSCGWGSPFLLVPEVTNVDAQTLNSLATAVPEDYYLSNASPLGVPFNNFRKSSAEVLRKSRIDKGKPGSPCLKKFLQFDTEFTKEPICTASVKYQYFKLKQLKETCTTPEEYEVKAAVVKEKDCLCEGLSEPALMVNNIQHKHSFGAVTICPGPNLAFFSGTFTLQEMVDHIYGRINILNKLHRPNMFINELKLYVDYLQKEKQKVAQQLVQRKESYFEKFRENLLAGISYYHSLMDNVGHQAEELFRGMRHELDELETSLLSMEFSEETIMVN